MEKISKQDLILCYGGAISSVMKSLAISLINVIKAVMNVRSFI